VEEDWSEGSLRSEPWDSEQDGDMISWCLFDKESDLGSVRRVEIANAILGWKQ
jgi:hypothetical protein